MRIRGRALIIAVVVGLAVQIVFSLISNLITYFAFPAVTARGGVPGLPVGGSIVSLLACVCVLIIDLGVGLLYAALAAREGPLTGGDGALGAGIAGAIEGLFTGIVGVVITAIVLPNLSSFLSDIPPEVLEQTRIGLVVGGAIGAVLGLCIAFVRGAVMAAVGGALGAALFKPKVPATAA